MINKQDLKKKLVTDQARIEELTYFKYSERTRIVGSKIITDNTEKYWLINMSGEQIERSA